MKFNNKKKSERKNIKGQITISKFNLNPKQIHASTPLHINNKIYNTQLRIQTSYIQTSKQTFIL